MKLTHILQVVGIAFGLVVVAAILYPLFAVAKTGGKIQCLSHGKLQAMGIAIYRSDHDDWAPNFDWMEGIAPYVKNESAMHCLRQKDRSHYGFAANFNLLRMPEPLAPETVALTFEVNDPARNAIAQEIRPITEDRHGGRIAVSFADGHARWYQPKDIGTLTTDAKFPVKKRP